jgi:hypothetical protein
MTSLARLDAAVAAIADPTERSGRNVRMGEDLGDRRWDIGMPAEWPQIFVYIGIRADVGYPAHARDGIDIEPVLKADLAAPIESSDNAGRIKHLKKFAGAVGAAVISEYEGLDAEGAMMGNPFKEIGLLLFDRRDNADAGTPARLVRSIGC